MAAADTYELTIDQARDWQWANRWLVGRNQKSAVPKPGIEDWDFFLGFKEDYSDLTPIVLLTVGDGITVTPDGWIRYWMTSDVCETLPAKRLKFEVVAIHQTTNFKKTLAKGTALVKPKVI